MSKHRHIGRLFLFVACLGLSVPAPARAQVSFDKDLLRTHPKVVAAFRDVVAGPGQSTLQVLGDGKETALGIVVGADGWVLTKATLLRDNPACKLKDGKEVPAKVIGVHAAYDLALLKIDAKGLKPIAWRDTKDVLAGTWVASVGAGLEPVAIGVVSVPTRKLRPGDQPPKNLGSNSGYLGVSMDEAEGGAKIKLVAPGSPAEKAGVQVDDLIYQVGNTQITGVESMVNTVQRHKPGDTILLMVKRGKESVELKATLGKLPKGLGGNPAEKFGSALSDRRGGFPTILQHDTVIKPEDCGGPLVDLDGKAVGVNIARAGRTESYAIPAEDVLALLDDLKSGKLAPTAEPPVAARDDKNVLLRVADKLTKDDPKDAARANRFSKVHTVKLAAGTQVNIDLVSTDFDAYLRLEDDAGKQLAEDDDGGEELDARITFTAPKDGVYRIIVTTFVAGETGTYNLTVRPADKK